MTSEQPQRAAPPDDGGTDGSFTEPEQALLAEPGDTRASELVGKTPPQQEHGNRGFMWFLLSIVVLVLVMLAAGYFKNS
jgi:hypothetical protein